MTRSGSSLTGLKLILEHPRENKSLVLYEAHAVAIELIQRVREMSLNLRPSALDDFGLFPALDGLIKRFASQTKIIIHHNINPLEERRFRQIHRNNGFPCGSRGTYKHCPPRGRE